MKRTIRGYSSVTVRVYPKELGFCPVEVGLDPEAEGTLISVTPTLVSRIFSPSLGCTAKSVIIWVCSQNDMRMWKEWINDAEENYFDEKHKQTSKPPATSITPK